MSADLISLRGIEVFAHHGVLEHEKANGQKFSLDVDLEVDLSAAGRTDDLSDTVDYGALASGIRSVVADERWDLIERVAERVAEFVLSEPKVLATTVTVHKPGAPIPVPFRDVAVTIHRRR